MTYVFMDIASNNLSQFISKIEKTIGGKPFFLDGSVS